MGKVETTLLPSPDGGIAEASSAQSVAGAGKVPELKTVEAIDPGFTRKRPVAMPRAPSSASSELARITSA